MTATSSVATLSTIGGHTIRHKPLQHTRPPEAFISVQFEKVGTRDLCSLSFFCSVWPMLNDRQRHNPILQTPSRDLMLNDFLKKKNAMGTVLKNPEEMERVKRCAVQMNFFSS